MNMTGYAAADYHSEVTDWSYCRTILCHVLLLPFTLKLDASIFDGVCTSLVALS